MYFASASCLVMEVRMVEFQLLCIKPELLNGHSNKAGDLFFPYVLRCCKYPNSSEHFTCPYLAVTLNISAAFGGK